MSTSRKSGNEIDYFSYNGEQQTLVPQSNTFNKWHQTFSTRLKGLGYALISSTDDEDKHLLCVGSDRLCGTYYTNDTQKNEFKEVFDLMPQLKLEHMAEMRPVRFKSRDRLDLYAYLTIPSNASVKDPVPLILNPHVDRYGPRDDWGCNPETQLFASRGYAILQINYCGSGGYGKSFYLAVSKQIGRNMLNDLEDGVAYAQTLDFIGAEKTAI